MVHLAFRGPSGGEVGGGGILPTGGVGGGAYRMKGANNWMNIQLGISEMSLDDIVTNIM